MKLILFFMTLIGTSTLLANTQLVHTESPKNKNQLKSVTPIDIVKTDVTWNFNDSTSLIEAEAQVYFQTKKVGTPYLLLNPNSVAWDSDGTKLNLTPLNDLKGNFFSLGREYKKNILHKIELKYTFKHDKQENKIFLPVSYSQHKYIENGIPANAMDDRFIVNLSINIDTKENYKVIANGKVRKNSNTSFAISFPSFTSIAHFIDIVKEDNIVTTHAPVIIKSVNGRSLNLFVYSTTDDDAKNLVPTFSKLVKQTFHDLEKRFGPYPHENQIIMKVSNKKNGTGSFAGALALSSFYIEHMSHELSHHWFLQSLSPKNGADTWFYEGLGYWVPYLKILNGFEKVNNLQKSIYIYKGENSLWSNESIFTAKDIQSPHQSGAIVIAALNTALKKRIDNSHISPDEKTLYKKHGLDIILKKMAQDKAHSTVSTLDFKSYLENKTGIDFSDIFNFYMKF